MAGQRKVSMTDSDLKYMQEAIVLARKCKPEDKRPHPKVGVVIITEDNQVLHAYRGETGPGNHAEFAVLDKKHKDRSFAGATVYTTLEPCSSRKHPKVDCAQRLIDAQVKRVFIGMIDPNPTIDGAGRDKLVDAKIDVHMFENKLQAEIRSLNREFIRYWREAGRAQGLNGKVAPLPRKRGLDDLYRRTNSVFWKANLGYDRSDMMLHLVEACCEIGQLVSQKRKQISEKESIVKSIANWMMICGKVGVKSVSDMLWLKFPYVCPYCYEAPHRQDDCVNNKKRRQAPDWKHLRAIAEKHANKRPSSLGAWQRMFAEIYPVSQSEIEFGPTFARLMEELGELATAIRLFEVESDQFLYEAADLFAWLMRIPNIIDQKHQVSKRMRGRWLETAFLQAYPGNCLICGHVICDCSRVQPRPASQVSGKQQQQKRAMDRNTMFMTPDQARTFFAPSSVAKRS